MGLIRIRRIDLGNFEKWTVFTCIHVVLKSVFLKKVLQESIHPKICKNCPINSQLCRRAQGRFCKFLDELILSSTFLKKRTLLGLFRYVCLITKNRTFMKLSHLSIQLPSHAGHASFVV